MDSGYIIIFEHTNGNSCGIECDFDGEYLVCVKGPGCDWGRIAKRKNLKKALKIFFNLQSEMKHLAITPVDASRRNDYYMSRDRYKFSGKPY